MNDAQIWTMFGAFSAAMLGGFGLMTRLIRSEIGGLRGEMRGEIGGLRGEMHARFDTVDGCLDSVDQKIDQRVDGLGSVTAARFTDVDHRLEAIETDMSLIKGHLIGQRSA